MPDSIESSSVHPAGTAVGDRPSAFPALLIRNRNFVLIWLAYGISALGDHLSEVAILKSLDAVNREDTTKLMARMSICFMGPFFVFGPFMGWLSDRLPRKWIMFGSDCVRVGIMLGFAALMSLTWQWSSWGPFLPLVLLGIFAACFSPARNSLLPTVIREDQLVRANALIAGLGIIATMMGFFWGGLLAERYTPLLCYRVDSLTYLASALFVLMIIPPKRGLVGAGTHRAIGLRALLSGYGYVLGHKRVLQVIALAAVFWASGAVVRSTLPAIVTQVYGGSYAAIGRYQAAIGLGFVLGALILTALGDALRGAIAITWSLMGGGASAAFLSATILLPLGETTAGRLGAVACVVLGVFGAGVMTSCSALLQRIVPDHYRGRVFGVNDQCTIGALLVATGLLAVPEWAGIDRWAGQILAGVALLMSGAGLMALWRRLSESPFGVISGFLLNLNEFYTRWWFRLRRVGPCTVPATGAVIVAANHTTSIDPLLLTACCRHRVIGFMAAREYYHLPLAGLLMRRIDCIPVTRSGQDLRSTRAALEHLGRGKVLGIFPEGRIRRPGETLEPREGVALLALRSGAAVVPAFISGTKWSSSAILPFFLRQRARVRFGKPIEPADFPSGGRSRESARELARLIMTRIRDLEVES